MKPLPASAISMLSLCLFLSSAGPALSDGGRPATGVGPLGGVLRGPESGVLDQPLPFGPAAPARPAPVQPAYPLYRWPLGWTLSQEIILVNYVDHDAGSGLLDYSGGAHTYDGHSGTDYALRNFRRMDRGCPVVAAVGGTVMWQGAAAPGAFDRSCTFSWPDDGNWIWVSNGDGTYSEYLHLRKWSLAVQVGELVAPGDTLGYVGSSGYSTAPHLHFETGDYFGGPYAPRDPYHGPSNPLPSLWQAQEPYLGSAPLRFEDLGVFSDAAVGGSVFNTSYCDILEGIQAPVVFGIHEPHLNNWFQFEGNAGDLFRVEVVKPNQTVWAWFEDTLGWDARYDWFWAYWFWDGNVSASDYGLWTLKAYANGSLSRQVSFQVGPATIYGPRLRPAGRSFRINGAAQTDTLHTTALSPPVTLSLLNAPPFVSLAGNVVTVGPVSGQPTRSSYFQVRAADSGGRADTAWYHVVDLSKPIRPASGVEPDRARAPGLRLRAVSAPGGRSVTFEVDTPVAGETRLEIFDASGRVVRRFEPERWSSGAHRLSWDGRDDRGVAVTAGRYFGRFRLGDLAGTVGFSLIH